MADRDQDQAGLDIAKKARVFISYSRKDARFAQRLRDGLLEGGYGAFLDTADILPGEDWRHRIEGLILAADVVVFVISPDSIARWDNTSPTESVCAWEVRRTLALGKQLTPIMWRRPVDNSMPPELVQFNWISFEAFEHSSLADDAQFDTAFSQLDTALRLADLLWVREHSTWVARAVEWDRSVPARPEGRLLRAGDIAAAEAWMNNRPSGAPELPHVVVDYIGESHAKERRDITTLRRTAGRAFVKPTLQALADNDIEHALRLATAGALVAQDLNCDRSLDTRVWGPAVRAICDLRTRAVLRGHTATINGLTMSPDGSMLLTASSDRSAIVWNTATGTATKVLQGHSKAIRSAAFSPDGRFVLTASADMTARLWTEADGTEIAVLRGHVDEINGAAFSADGRLIVTAASDKTARIWDATNGQELWPEVGDGGNREGGISWGCLTTSLLQRRSDMPCPTITSSD